MLRLKTTLSHLTKARSNPSQQLVRRFGKSSEHDHYYEDFISSIRRKKLLIKAAMTYKYKPSVQVPSFISRDLQRVPLPALSLSELAGHGAFVFLAMSYLESDFLNLRVYAFSGITLSIIFQYYREIPLWIPIRWNTFFLLINAVMIGILLKEQSDANNITADERYLYDKCFKHKGMSQVDFLHLISMAKRLDAEKGTKLVQQDKKNTRVYLVKNGTLTVYKGDTKVGSIRPTQFVGAMSYLKWQSAKQEKEQRLLEQQQLDEAAAAASKESSPPSVFSSILGTSAANMGYHMFFDNLMSHNFVASTDQSSTQLMATSSSDDTSPSSAAPTDPAATPDEGHMGQADVVCNDDCVVYYWKFRDLYELIQQYPYLGLVIERAISEDLNKKMSSTWEDELKTRYKALLSQAVRRFHKEHFNAQQSALQNNNVNPAIPVVSATAPVDNTNSTISSSNSNSSSSSTSMSSQQTLLLQQHLNSADLASITKFRETNQISSLDHDIIVQDVLRQQSVLDAEEAVHAHDAAMSHQYAEILKNELKRPRGISESAKRHLRDYRLTHHISGETHVALLKDLGWTVDEYEMGRQLTPKDLAHYQSRAASFQNAPLSINVTPHNQSNSGAGSSPTNTPGGGNTSPSSLNTMLSTKFGRSALQHEEEEEEEDLRIAMMAAVAASGNANAGNASPTPVATEEKKGLGLGSGYLWQRLTSGSSSGSKGSRSKHDNAVLHQAAELRRMVKEEQRKRAMGDPTAADEVQLQVVLDGDLSHSPVITTLTATVPYDHDGALENGAPAEEQGSWVGGVGYWLYGGWVWDVMGYTTGTSGSTNASSNNGDLQQNTTNHENNESRSSHQDSAAVESRSSV